MSPSELMIRTIHWTCSCCGEVTRDSRRPQDCSTCGRPGDGIEESREACLPSD